MKGLESFLSRVQQDASNKVLVESFLHLLDGTSIELRFSYYYRLVKILAVHDRVYARNIYKKILTRHTGAQKKPHRLPIGSETRGDFQQRDR